MATKRVSTNVGGDSSSVGKEAESTTVLSPRATTVRLLSVEQDVKILKNDVGEIKKTLEIICEKLGIKPDQQSTNPMMQTRNGTKELNSKQEKLGANFKTRQGQEKLGMEQRIFQEVDLPPRMVQEIDLPPRIHQERRSMLQEFNNNCMVDFVREGFLGSNHEFRNRFQNPIENGQHTNSTLDDVKIMNQRSHILYEQLRKRSFFAGYQALAQIWNHLGILQMTKEDKYYVKHEDAVENFLADESSSEEHIDSNIGIGEKPATANGNHQDKFVSGFFVKDWWTNLLHANSYIYFSGRNVASFWPFIT